MANTFRLKRSSVANKVPTTGDLQLGELALNTHDGKLYTKKDNGTASIVEIGAAGGVSDGDKGDITVSSSGTAWTIDNDAVTYAKIQNVSGSDKLLGRSSAGAGDVEEIACTAAGRALLDDADAAAQRATLGLGTLATQSGTFSGTSSGTNTGDQTITLTGDVTGSGTGSFAATLANTAVTPGSYTNANVTIDAKGRITAASNGAAGGVTSFSAGTTGLTPSTGTTGAITLAGTLAVANGGTGVTTSTGSGSVVLSTSPTLVTPLLGTPTSGTLTNCTGYTFANLASKPTTLSGYGITDAAPLASPALTGTPTAPTAAAGTNTTQLATTAFVQAATDAARQGLSVKLSCRAATTANITLSGTQTIDGVAVAAGNRVLVKNQTTGSENGIYVAAAGAWTRATDFDADADVVDGAFTFVEEGTVNADSGWVLTTDGTIVVGTTSLAFAQFSGAGQITAGAGLTKTGNTIDVVGTAGRIVANADSIDLATAGTAGTYRSITTDAYGRVTSGTNPTTFAGYGISETSANLAAAITDETGSGALVFATSPTLVTPLLGTPTSGTLTNCTGYTFANLASRPTTISGYGITDAPTLSGNNALTGANTFTNSTGQIFRQAATQDGILLRGRAGGTTSLNVEIVPGTLTASRTLTAPDVSGTIITTGDTSSITNTMLAGSIANAKLANSTISGVALGGTLNALTLGTGLTGTSYNGSAAVTAAVSYGTTAGTACQGNDSRLSDARTPTAHTHGNITNAGAIGSTANLPIITTTSGVLTTGSFGTAAGTFCQGNDSRLSDTRANPNAVTFNNGGAGGASGSTYTGSAALTVSYNTVGAPSTTGTGASGSWGISITGSSASCTGNSATTSQRTFSNVRTDGINRGSYGSISVAGSTNGYSGIDFTDEAITLMMDTTYQGVYVNNNAWLWYWNNGTLEAGSVPWARVTSRPTTLSGYGITDGASNAANGCITLNNQTISSNYTFTAGQNGVSAGPVTISAGVTVTVTSGCGWSIV